MEFIDEYLELKQNRSKNSYLCAKSQLNEFFNYINKNINEISIEDVYDYFKNYVDKKDLKNNSKETTRYVLKGFFDFIASKLLEKQILYTNPVPSKNVFEFSIESKDIKHQSKKNYKLMNDIQLEQIMDFCKKNRNYRDFILLGLIITTGARISEITSIQISDINLKERFFETGFIDGSRKSSMRTKEGLLFFFSKKFAIYLENYLLRLPKEQVFLFSGANLYCPLHIKSSYYLLTLIKKELGIEKLTWHYFRHNKITRMKEMGCALDVSEMIMNHKPSSTEGEFYTHLSIEKKRELFDKLFPYYNLKYF